MVRLGRVRSLLRSAGVVVSVVDRRGWFLSWVVSGNCPDVASYNKGSLADSAKPFFGEFWRVSGRSRWVVGHLVSSICSGVAGILQVVWGVPVASLSFSE